MTNFEKIKNMSVEEMAKFLKNILFNECPYGTRPNGSCLSMLFKGCGKCLYEWLQSEVEDESKISH